MQPWFGGARTLDEQMLGIEHAIAEARGKTVLDLGCAEGLIALEFAKAGAVVSGCDYNESMIEAANDELSKTDMQVEFLHADISDMIVQEPRKKFDIVLALAVLHKLPDPANGVRFCAESSESLIVIRLPAGSTGMIRSKHHPEMQADVSSILVECGFKRERKEPGPRGEWVQYWRRK